LDKQSQTKGKPMGHIRKAVFPVAGMGTRFLPATKSVPKEMLTLVDRPLIQYAVDEARQAGIEEFIFITAPGKGALEDYFSSAPALEMRLQTAGKNKLLRVLDQTKSPDGSMTFIRQDNPRGLGHAVSLAKRLIGDEAFAVILPDDVVQGKQGCLSQMVKAHKTHGGHMIGAMDVPKDQVSSYGILDTLDTVGQVARARGMVEKPSIETAPSTLAAIGRYILKPSIFAQLDVVPKGAGGEIQLTDAIAADLDHTGVNGFRFAGQRFDCGSVTGLIHATVAYAMERPDLDLDLDWLVTQRNEAA
jgi:UTP--glucose-1-phosphate uridylyltransferase